MNNLFPSAQAVLDAAVDVNDLVCTDSIAAALRTVANQLTPYSVEDVPGAAFCRNKLLAIANELKAL
jgi:hypothetical protein